jgi:malonate decarboxylase delta subunit
METMNYKYTATNEVRQSAHVGMVSLGDLEIVLEPIKEKNAYVVVRTKVDGCGEIWKNILDRFFLENAIAVNIRINDLGARPGKINMRLFQALEVSCFDTVK